MLKTFGTMLAADLSNWWIYVIVFLLLFIMFTVMFLASRYKRCPSDRILVIYGRVGKGESAKCIHGGGAFVWPLIQNYSFLSLTPMTISIPLQNALSMQNIRINVPSTFTVGISIDPAIMNNAAERLLRLPPREIEEMAKEIGFKEVEIDENVAKVSVVGIGMKTHTGVASKMFSTLAEAKINIQNISTSEIVISCIVDQKDGEKALKTLHAAFELDKED